MPENNQENPDPEASSGYRDRRKKSMFSHGSRGHGKFDKSREILKNKANFG
jgi:hypothetical protein